MTVVTKKYPYLSTSQFLHKKTLFRGNETNKNIGYVWRGIKANLRSKNSLLPPPF